MAIALNMSETKENLMRAFAGESQARNRYTFAAGEARKQQLHVLEQVFQYTAAQEQAHAKVFYQFLKEAAGETIAIDGSYPVDIAPDISQLLKMAHHNEYEEYETVYPAFAETAKREGFLQIAAAFQMIAEIERTHGNRFHYLAELMAQNQLFSSDQEEQWVCLHCGYIYQGKEAPKKCPVCFHDQGYYIRQALAPFEIIPLRA